MSDMRRITVNLQPSTDLALETLCDDMNVTDAVNRGIKLLAAITKWQQQGAVVRVHRYDGSELEMFFL